MKNKFPKNSKMSYNTFLPLYFLKVRNWLNPRRMNMFFNKNKPSIDSVMNKTIVITGDLTFKGTYHLAGRVNGNVTGDSESLLIIDETAVIEGDVFCAHIKLNGKVNGSVTSSTMLELKPKANVVGDIFYNMLKMESGSIISGKVNHVVKPEVQNEVVKQYDSFGLKPA
jgi:cytoskeletal protein CcmA (bactofilin family)